MADLANAVENQDHLLLIGRIAMQDTLSVMVETTLWIFYLAVFSFAIKIQLRRGIRATASVFMLVVTVALFSISTVLWALVVTQLFQGFRVMLLHNDAGDLGQGVDERYKLLGQKSVFMEGLFLLTMIIADSVVIWRAWVISNRHKIIFAPIIFLLAATAFAVIDVICLTEVEDDVSHTTSIPPGSRTCTWSEPIAWALSLCTNILSTSIIAWQVWSHRRFMKNELGNRYPRSRSERVLVLLVESGFVYCLFWFTQLVLFFPLTRADRAIWAFEVLAPFGDQVSGLYPTIIIVLVNMQHSLHDTHMQEISTIAAATAGEGAGPHSLAKLERGEIMPITFRPFSSDDSDSFTNRMNGFHDFENLERPVLSVGEVGERPYESRKLGKHGDCVQEN